MIIHVAQKVHTNICETFQLKRNQQKWQTHCCRRGIGFPQMRRTFISFWVCPFLYLSFIWSVNHACIYRLVASMDIVSHSHHILREPNNYRREKKWISEAIREQQHQIRHSIDRMIWFFVHKWPYFRVFSWQYRGAWLTEFEYFPQKDQKLTATRSAVAVNVESDLRTILFFFISIYFWHSFRDGCVRWWWWWRCQRDSVWNHGRYVSRIL